MAWLRRRRATASTEVVATASTELAVRTEQALMSLAVNAAEMRDRLDLLEERVGSFLEQSLDPVTQDDVMEIRIHSAKVAAEVSRMSVNLRARIDDLAAHLPTERERRTTTLAESIIDLADGLDTRPLDLTEPSGDWAQTA